MAVQDTPRIAGMSGLDGSQGASAKPAVKPVRRLPVQKDWPTWAASSRVGVSTSARGARSRVLPPDSWSASARICSCQMCSASISSEATITLTNAPLIITFVDCIIGMYLGETTCVFMFWLSGGLARQETALIGMQTTRIMSI